MEREAMKKFLEKRSGQEKMNETRTGIGKTSSSEAWQKEVRLNRETFLSTEMGNCAI